MHELSEWIERCTDQKICWMVLRLINCKLHWLKGDGSFTKKQREAVCWTDREQAYQNARQNSGLLYCYDR